MKKLIITLALILFIGIGGSAFQILVVEAKPEMKKPEREFERWGSTLVLGVPLGAEAPEIDDGERMTWDYGDKDVSIYELSPEDGYKNGGFEIDVVLKTKPVTNRIHFKIDAKDYDFFYQPALDKEQEYIDFLNNQSNGEEPPVAEEIIEPVVEIPEEPLEEEPMEEKPSVVEPESETTIEVEEEIVTEESLVEEEIIEPVVEIPEEAVEEEPPVEEVEESIEEETVEPLVEEISEEVIEDEPFIGELVEGGGLTIQGEQMPEDVGQEPIESTVEPVDELEKEEPLVEEVVEENTIEEESPEEENFEEEVVEEQVVENTPVEESIEQTIKNLPEEERYLVGEVDYCTETDCYNIFGMVINHRPENVVGSYAVYHKTKKNHKIGEENYKTGKVAHIYRPKIIDANGEWVWGEMEIKGNQLIVTVPQDFLDNGAYPITVDPALGYDTDPGSTTLVIQDIIWGMYYSESVTMTEDGTAQSVWIWWAGGVYGAAHDVDHAKMGIYTFTTLPRNYVDATSEITTFPTSAGWLEFTGASAALSSGSKYVPVWWHQADWMEGNVGYDSSGYGEYWIDNQNYGSAWPATLANNGHDDYKLFAAYIEYTTGGGEPVAAPPKPAPIPIILF